MDKSLITIARETVNQSLDNNPSLEISLDCKLAKRLISTRLDPGGYSELRRKAFEIAKGFGIEVSRGFRPLQFLRFNNSSRGVYLALLERCYLPYGNISLGIIPRDLKRLSDAGFDQPVIYRSFGTKTKDHIDHLLDLFQEAWLRPVQEYISA